MNQCQQKVIPLCLVDHWFIISSHRCGLEYLILVDNRHVMLCDFKSSFYRMTHISCSIVNINIYKYKVNLVNLKIL
jgi:hypothetical protein